MHPNYEFVLASLCAQNLRITSGPRDDLDKVLRIEILPVEETSMTKRILVSLAVMFLAYAVTPAPAVAQSNGQAKSDATSIDKLSKKPVSITGTISEDGSTLVSDKDSKTYKVINPDFVRENAGQHVHVSARVNKENTEMLVSSVMVQNAEPMVANKGDAAFRR